MKEVVLISASPRAENETASEYFAALEEKCIAADGLHISRINVRQSLKNGLTSDAYAAIFGADAVVFSFPLYFFCLPGMLMRFLQGYYQFCLQHMDNAKNPKIYAVVNCGFPQPEICSDAARVIQSFGRAIGAEYRFGVLIGGGGVVHGAKEAPFMKKTNEKLTAVFSLMGRDIAESGAAPAGNILISLNMPQRLYHFMGDRGWILQAKSNGLRKKDLYGRPYGK